MTDAERAALYGRWTSTGDGKTAFSHEKADGSGTGRYISYCGGQWELWETPEGDSQPRITKRGFAKAAEARAYFDSLVDAGKRTL